MKTIHYGLLALIVVGIAVVFLVFYKPDLSREQLAEFQTDASRFLDLADGANMHYRDEGHPDGPVLVMIHGGLGSLHNWQGWIEPLSRDFRLISMDLLGHGLTGTSPSKIYTRTAMRDAVHELLQRLGVQRYTVAGNSFGGGIALEMALEFPQEVERLILVDSEGVPNGEDGYDASLFTDQAAVTPDDPAFTKLAWYERLGARFIGPRVVRSTLAEMISDQSLLTDELVEGFARIIRHRGNRDAQILLFRQGLYVVAKAGPQDLLPRLGELRMPTLIIQGEEDTLVPMAVAEKFEQHIANSTLARIEGAGHMPMIEKPEQTAAIVRAWFVDRSR